MNSFLSVLFPYDYAARVALITAIAAYGCFITLRAGVFAVPQAGVMAIGGYTSALLSLQLGVPVPLAELAGVVAGGFTGLLLTLALGRLDGIRLAIATIAFSEIVRILLLNLPFTGGGVGLSGVARVTTDWQIVGAVLLCALLFRRFARTATGDAMIALRVDPTVANHQGISIFKYRLGVFVVSGLTSGLAGVLFAHLAGFLVPDNFGFAELTTLLAAAIVGGMSSAIGPLIGALIIVGIPEISGTFQGYRYVFNGIIIVAVVALAPGGVAVLLKQVAAKIRRPRTRAARPIANGTPSLGGLPANPDAAVLKLTQLSKSYGGVQALRDISFEVQAGEFLGLIGPNGSGKTTLLNVISGVTPPTRGGFEFNGVSSASVAGRPHRMARLGLSRTFQGVRLIGTLSLLANVITGAYCRRTHGLIAQMLGANRAENDAFESQARTLLHRIGVDSDTGSSVAGLPYGTLRRIEIARALMSRPCLVLFDEPAAGMTATETAEVFDFMRALCRAGTSVIVVEHDVGAIARYCDRVVVLNFGQILTIGRPAEVIRSPEVVEAYVGTRARV